MPSIFTSLLQLLETITEKMRKVNILSPVHSRADCGEHVILKNRRYHMQPHEVLGIAGMFFAVIATILQLIGRDDTRGIRAVGGVLFFGLGLIFAVLARQRALAIFPYEKFPVSLAKCYVVIMVTLWIAILPHMRNRLFRALAWCGLAIWTCAGILLFVFAS